jgi:hypothetical protein
MRKSILLFITFFLLNLTILKASSLRIAPETDKSSGCDLEEAGFTEKESFLKFFADLKSAAAKKDLKQLNSMVLLPLKLNTHKTISLKTMLEVEQKTAEIFTPKILQLIVSQKIEQLTCQYQGIMLGDGEVWIKKKGKQIGIIAINPILTN